jgi:hypothetical protein
MKALGVIIALAIAHAATRKHATPTSPTPNPGMSTGRLAVSRDDDTVHFTATCDDQGAVLTLHPDTTSTRPAATQSCRAAAHEYAALRSLDTQGG